MKYLTLLLVLCVLLTAACAPQTESPVQTTEPAATPADTEAPAAPSESPEVLESAPAESPLQTPGESPTEEQGNPGEIRTPVSELRFDRIAIAEEESDREIDLSEEQIERLLSLLQRDTWTYIEDFPAMGAYPYFILYDEEGNRALVCDEPKEDAPGEFWTLFVVQYQYEENSVTVANYFAPFEILEALMTFAENL